MQLSSFTGWTGKYNELASKDFIGGLEKPVNSTIHHFANQGLRLPTVLKKYQNSAIYNFVKEQILDVKYYQNCNITKYNIQNADTALFFLFFLIDLWCYRNALAYK